ncbi:TrlF family AAA-like ATPase [Dactylosporangium salmoneum]|uniref:TrlF family AAA-like ATPase n=1 Tax=Dactylosporangium salmoneum TaxID=53361 RepID=UPI0031E19EB2
MGYSRWTLADLQVHTPADFNHKYGAVGGPVPNAGFANILIKAHADAGVRVIAVTDHNTLAWYPELAAAGARHGVTVFPGIEFNVNKCHLMAIWDCTDDGYRRGEQFLARLFPPDGPPGLTDKRFPNPTLSGSPLELAKKATERYGALVLAPHATAKDIGLFGKNVCNTSAQVAQSGYVLGFDVYGNDHADVLTNPKSQFDGHRPAWFISGDVRSLDTVGERAVYLKLGEPPTLESLRQAFLMPENRIRFPEKLRDKYGHVTGIRFLPSADATWPHITRIAISGGFHDGVTVDLGPGLNAIIGGKGTGKSTTIEIARHVCGGAESTVSDNRANRRTNFPANATATFGVVAEDLQRYDIVRSGDSTPARLTRNGRDIGVDPGRRFAINVFGQRELAQLAEHQDALRDFVAISAGPEMGDAKTDASNCLAELNRIDGDLRFLEAEVSRAEEHEAQLADLNDQLKVAGQRGAAEQVTASQQLTTVEEEVAAVQNWLTDAESLIAQIRQRSVRPAVQEHDCVPEQLNRTADRVAAALVAAADGIEAATREANDVIETLIAEHRSRVDARRHEINVALADAGLKDPEELAHKQRTAAELARAVAAVPGQREQIVSHLAYRAKLLDDLRTFRTLVSQQFQDAAAELNTRLGNRVRVVVQPLADTTDLDNLLERLLASQHVRADQRAKLAGAGPATLVAALTATDDSLLKLGVTDLTANKARQLGPSEVRQIEQCDMQDLVTVEINVLDTGDPRWLDVRKVSPGQKATAMLALALATGTDPLIIDQPEDDLDNRFIYDQVVRQLAEVADRRQVIVATHNPNIPILGDAEMILALDATVDQSRVVACGAIDEPDVADAARHILEGGDEAFKARARRYRAAR